MSVKRYTIYYNERERDMYVAESQDGKYVHHSDYAALLDSHNALVEAVAWERECEELHGSRAAGFVETWANYIAARAEVDRLISGTPAPETQEKPC